MSREIITIAVGGAGCRMALEFWARIMAEHGISPEGRRTHRQPPDDNIGTFFVETSAGAYVPRVVFADLDPATRDEIRNHRLARVLHLDFVVTGRRDGASNVARGRELAREGVADKVLDRVRKLADTSKNFQGFVLFHATGGGTGSGLGAELLDRLRLDYRKKSVISFSLLPSFVFQRAATEAYNTMFALASLRDRTALSFVFDNDALYHQCQRSLAIKDPSLADLNRLIGQAAADVTALLRYASAQADLNTYQTSLVLGPGRQFIAVSSAPRATRAKLGSPHPSVLAISDQVLAPEACLAELDASDPSVDQYVAAILIYRGKSASKEIHASLERLKAKGRLTFVPSISAGLKSFQIDAAPASLSGDAHAPADRSVTLLAASTAMSTYLGERVDRGTELMHEGRAYMHWFAAAGIDADAFASARAELVDLIEGYADLRDT